MSDVNAILLISCPDGKGIVAQISEFIFKNNGNIVHAAQHTSKDDKLFFTRVFFDVFA
jgi:formyltetrahydrofolate deformylase